MAAESRRLLARSRPESAPRGPVGVPAQSRWRLRGFLPVPMNCAQSRPPLQLAFPSALQNGANMCRFRARGSEPCACLERHLWAIVSPDQDAQMQLYIQAPKYFEFVIK